VTKSQIEKHVEKIVWADYSKKVKEFHKITCVYFDYYIIKEGFMQRKTKAASFFILHTDSYEDMAVLVLLLFCLIPLFKTCCAVSYFFGRKLALGVSFSQFGSNN
jgi:hypothetical protein